MICLCLCDVFPSFGTYNEDDKSIMKDRKWTKDKAGTNFKMFLQMQLIFNPVCNH